MSEDSAPSTPKTHVSSEMSPGGDPLNEPRSMGAVTPVVEGEGDPDRETRDGRRDRAPVVLQGKRSWLLGGLALVAVGLGVAFFFQGGGGAPPVGGPGGGLAAASGAGLPVSVLPVVAQAGYESESRHVGRLVARRESALGFDRGGRLLEVTSDLGDPVAKGTVVARLDTRALDQAEAQTRASRDAARASVDELEARLELAQLTADRKAALVKQSAVTRQSYDDARIEVQALGANLAGAKAEVARLDAELESLAVDRDLSMLTVPYDAVVTARHLDEGTAVQPGQVVLDIREAGPPEARMGLPRTEAQALNEGQAVNLEASGVILSATVRRVVGSVNLETRTVPVVLDLAPDSPGLPGQVVHMVTTHHVEDPGFWLPLDALVEGRRGLWNTFLLVPDGGEGADPTKGIVERREVEVLSIADNRVFVRGDLAEGDRVVALGGQRLAPGQRVHAVQSLTLAPDGAITETAIGGGAAQ